MPTKQEVGQRLRLARFRRDMTLKEVATRSGMSATHISEIERGKTSPTIGALQRIADALEERAAHFVEEQQRSLSILTRRGERLTEYRTDINGQVVSMEMLTSDVPWGTMRIVRKLSKPGEVFERPPGAGEIVTHCLAGMVRYTVGDRTHVLRDGDTIQFLLENGYTFENIGDANAEVIAFVTVPGRTSW